MCNCKVGIPVLSGTYKRRHRVGTLALESPALHVAVSPMLSPGTTAVNTSDSGDNGNTIQDNGYQGNTQNYSAPATPAPTSTTPSPVFDSADIASLNAAWNYATQASNACSSFYQGLVSLGSIPAGMAPQDWMNFGALVQNCEKQEESLFQNGQAIAPNPTIQGVQSLQIFAANGLSYANQIVSTIAQYPSLSSSGPNAAQIQALCQDAANAMSGPYATAQAALAAAMQVANQGNAPASTTSTSTVPVITPTSTTTTPAPDTTPIVVTPLDWWDTPGFMGLSNGELVIGGSILGVLVALTAYKISK